MAKVKPPYPFLLHKLLELSSLDVPKDISFGINNVSMDSDKYLCIVDQSGINQNVQIIELMSSEKPIEIILQNQLPTAQSIGNLRNYDVNEPFNLSAEIQKLEIQKSHSSPSPFADNAIQSNHFSAAVSPVIHPSALVSLSRSIVTNVKHLIDNDVTTTSSGSVTNSNTDSDHETLNLTSSESPFPVPQWPMKVHGRWQILANDPVLAHKTSLTSRSRNLPCGLDQSALKANTADNDESFDYMEPNTSGDLKECCTVAIKAAFNIQLFDLRQESRIKTLKMNEGVRYWKFLDDSTIVLVSNFHVYQWNIASDDYPVKLFAVLEELQTSQIMNFKIDVNKKFAALFSISAHDNKVVGHIQLYSFTHKISKLLFGFAGDFYTHEVTVVSQSPDDNNNNKEVTESGHKKTNSDAKKEGMGGKATFNFFTQKLKRKLKKAITIFCFTNKLNNIISVERKLLNKHFFASKAGHSGAASNSSPKKVGSKLKSYLEEILNFKYSATEFELTSARMKDFPVSLFIVQKLALLFLVTKMGYCSIIELCSGSFIYEQKISPQTVFLTTPVHSLYPSYYSFITINRDGRVVAVVLNDKELVNVVIENTRNFSLGLSLLHRDRNLEVSLEYVLREFLHRLSLRKFKDAADLIVLKNTKSSLRRLEIINKFLECDAYDKITPVHYYFHAILNSYPYLLHFEAVALVQEIMKFHNRTVAIKALDHWYSNGKLRPSQDIANLIKSIHPELTSKIEARKDHQPIDFYDPSAPISDFSASLLSRLEEELAREKEKHEEKKESKEVEFSDFILSNSESQPGKESTSSAHDEFDLFKQFR